MAGKATDTHMHDNWNKRTSKSFGAEWKPKRRHFGSVSGKAPKIGNKYPVLQRIKLAKNKCGIAIVAGRRGTATEEQDGRVAGERLTPRWDCCAAALHYTRPLAAHGAATSCCANALTTALLPHSCSRWRCPCLHRLDDSLPVPLPLGP